MNSCTPEHLCKVKYPDFERAIERVYEELGASDELDLIALGKSDLKSAFCFIPLRIKDIPWLLMKARNPIDGNWYYFVDKCLPFGSSISCSHFQKFSDALAYIQKVKSGGEVPINYLDDFLFAAFSKLLCDQQVQTFLDVCDHLGVPVALEKTEWGAPIIVFLGLLIDAVRKIVSIPVDKVHKAQDLIDTILSCKKIKMHQLQCLCGFLNFLCRCIIPGRAFTRRLYAFTANLHPHHHIRVSQEMKLHLRTWKTFLSNPSVYCRPFRDFTNAWTVEVLDFYTDSSRNFRLGFGGICGSHWIWGQWN